MTRHSDGPLRHRWTTRVGAAETTRAAFRTARIPDPVSIGAAMAAMNISCVADHARS